jgi:hypothetical protein
MKLTFTKDELIFLHNLCDQMLIHATATRDRDGGKLMHAFKRLKAKFTNNAAIVFLKKSERSLLMTFTAHVIAGVGSNIAGNKVEIAQGALEKLEA